MIYKTNYLNSSFQFPLLQMSSKARYTLTMLYTLQLTKSKACKKKTVRNWRSKEDRDNEDNVHLVELFRVIVVDSVAFFKRTFLSRSSFFLAWRLAHFTISDKCSKIFCMTNFGFHRKFLQNCIRAHTINGT